jgi:hypothetical protein
MHIGSIPSLRFDRVFGVTTFELVQRRSESL